ncbi:MAG: hypothetical protein H6727_02560 [Myxococcales bacterium]|nr:hypothetical protein [Myxococcales bacterium]
MPPPLRYPSLHPPPLIQSHKPRYIVLFTLIATLLFAQTALTACPEPSSQTDGATEQTEQTEGGLEKTEPSAEKTEIPEEAGNPEESATPEKEVVVEEAGNPEEPTVETQLEKEPDGDPNAVVISALEGTGTIKPINYDAFESKPSDAQEADHRYTDTWVLTGQNLDRIDKIVLVQEDNNTEVTEFQISKKESNSMTLTFPKKYLLAGYFFLVAYAGQTEVVRAKTLVVQGEGFDQATLNDVKALINKVKVSGDNLEITAESIKVTPVLANGKVTLDLSASAVIKAGNNSIDFTGETITVTTKSFAVKADKVNTTSKTFSLDTETFEAKGTNGTSLKLDDTAHNITLSAKQKNSTTNTATFSLDGGDANMTNTVLPSATFNRMNVHIENGDGKTDSMNKLGNLIIGYNAPRSNPPTGYNRDGSHYLVIGDNHGYTSYGGIVVGYQHLVTAQYASVSGGEGNSATAQYASVSGGEGNSATAQYASISGGSGNTASAPYASVSGGQGNQAVSDYASVSGGKSGTAGVSNNKSGTSHAYVCGGNGKNAITQHSIACDGP